jgi:hypothetical protein
VVWAWTAVEAHLAIICASAPALKVFFKQYLNVTALSNSLQNSWRQREYQRKGYSADKGSTGFHIDSSGMKSGNSNSTDSNNMQDDVELGGMKGIEVTRELDIDSEGRSETTETFFDSEHSSPDGLQRSHLRQLGATETPWLIIDPAENKSPRRYPSLRRG